MGDATEAYGGRLRLFLRKILFIRPDTFVICDELEAQTPATYQWLLHARTEMALDPAAQTALISVGDARLLTRFVAPTGLELTQTSGFPVAPEREAPDQFHLTAATYRADDEARVPAAEAVAGEGGVGVSLRWADGSSALVVWRAGEATMARVDGVESEAEVALIRRDAAGAVRSTYSYGGRAVRLD